MAKIDYQTEVVTIDGEVKSLSDYEGKVLLIVNTASACGFTPHFGGLEQLWRDYRDRGLVVLGFPCNQFGAQDPGTDREIAAFCEEQYDVTFPMHSKIDVNGAGAHPLFEQLKSGARGLLGSRRIKWNFTKFLVASDGGITARFAPTDKPEELRGAIERLLS